MAAVQSITDIVLLQFLTNTAPQKVYFIAHYHLFLRKKTDCIYFSNYSIHWNINILFFFCGARK